VTSALSPEISAEARRRSGELGLPFHEAVMETNGYNISLVFSDLTVQAVDPGYTPFRRARRRTGLQVLCGRRLADCTQPDQFISVKQVCSC
jgi:hypothetical protein